MPFLPRLGRNGGNQGVRSFRYISFTILSTCEQTTTIWPIAIPAPDRESAKVRKSRRASAREFFASSHLRHFEFRPTSAATIEAVEGYPSLTCISCMAVHNVQTTKRVASNCNNKTCVTAWPPDRPAEKCSPMHNPAPRRFVPFVSFCSNLPAHLQSATTGRGFGSTSA